MAEMHRCTNKYIMGWEYYADDIQDIIYRGNTGVLWKANFADIFIKNFPDLMEVSRTKVPYISEKEKGNVDEIYLLTK